MAGFLSMLPNLVSGLGGGGGILNSIKNAAGNVLSDVGEGKVSSWGDFGKSLARAGAGLLGVNKDLPIQDNNNSNADYVNKKILESGKNAANETTMIQQAADRQPKGVVITPQSMGAAYKPLSVNEEKRVQHTEPKLVEEIVKEKIVKKPMTKTQKKKAKFFHAKKKKV
jgi:hypothetical protein